MHRAPSFFKQISFPESFVICGTGTTSHGLAAELCFGTLSFEFGSTNIYEWTFKNSKIVSYLKSVPSNLRGFPSDLRTNKAGNFLTLYLEASASSDSLIKPNCNVF